MDQIIGPLVAYTNRCIHMMHEAGNMLWARLLLLLLAGPLCQRLYSLMPFKSLTAPRIRLLLPTLGVKA